MLLTKADDNVIRFPDASSATLVLVVDILRTGTFTRIRPALHKELLEFCEKYDLVMIGRLVIASDAHFVDPTISMEALVWASKFNSVLAAATLMRRGNWPARVLVPASSGGFMSGEDAAKLPSTWVFALCEAAKAASEEHSGVDNRWDTKNAWYTFSCKFCDILAVSLE